MAVVGLYVLKVTRDSYTRLIEVDDQLILGATELRVAILEQVEGYRGFLLFGEEEHLKPWATGIERFRLKSDEMQKLATDPQALHALEEIGGIQRKFMELQKPNIELRRQGKLQESLKMTKEILLLLRQELFKRISAFIERQNPSLAQDRVKISGRIQLVNTVMVLISIVALICARAMAFLLTRTITRQLRDATAQLASASTEILATTTQIASSAAETATAVSETTTTVEEVKQTAQVASQKAKYVSDSAQKSTQVSKTWEKWTETQTIGGTGSSE